MASTAPNRAPRAVRIPAPPSEVALPADPEGDAADPQSAPRGGPRRSPASRPRSDLAPRPRAATAPTPRRARRRRGHHPPERSQRAATGRPIGSVAWTVCHAQPPAASMATSVPSPPSASGARRISSSGRASRQPSASAVATSTEVSEPLKESGATTTRMRSARAAVARTGPASATRGELVRPRSAGLREQRLAALEVFRDSDHRRSLHVGQLDDLEGQAARPERGSFIVEPSSANRRALRRSSSRFMTAWRITKDIRDRPSSSWLRWTRRSRSTCPRPSRPERSAMSIRWPISTA